MRTVLVKARPGRVAYTAPRGGQMIPDDKWLAVERTRWIDRLVHDHGDIEMTDLKDQFAQSQRATGLAPASPSEGPIESDVSVSVGVETAPRRGRSARH